MIHLLSRKESALSAYRLLVAENMVSRVVPRCLALSCGASQVRALESLVRWDALTRAAPETASGAGGLQAAEVHPSAAPRVQELVVLAQAHQKPYIKARRWTREQGIQYWIVRKEEGGEDEEGEDEEEGGDGEGEGNDGAEGLEGVPSAGHLGERKRQRKRRKLAHKRADARKRVEAKRAQGLSETPPDLGSPSPGVWAQDGTPHTSAAIPEVATPSADILRMQEGTPCTTEAEVPMGPLAGARSGGAETPLDRAGLRGTETPLDGAGWGGVGTPATATPQPAATTGSDCGAASARSLTEQRGASGEGVGRTAEAGNSEGDREGSTGEKGTGDIDESPGEKGLGSGSGKKAKRRYMKQAVRDPSETRVTRSRVKQSEGNPPLTPEGGGSASGGPLRVPLGPSPLALETPEGKPPTTPAGEGLGDAGGGEEAGLGDGGCWAAEGAVPLWQIWEFEIRRRAEAWRDLEAAEAAAQREAQDRARAIVLPYLQRKLAAVRARKDAERRAREEAQRCRQEEREAQQRQREQERRDRVRHAAAAKAADMRDRLEGLGKERARQLGWTVDPLGSRSLASPGPPCVGLLVASQPCDCSVCGLGIAVQRYSSLSARGAFAFRLPCQDSDERSSCGMYASSLSCRTLQERAQVCKSLLGLSPCKIVPWS